MNKFRNHVREADPECPRMCKMKFKASSMKGFPISELYDTLGTTKEIKSIMLPSPSEKELLKQIMDDEVGHDDVDDVIVDGWTKRIIKENKPICFEELHIQDVSSREIEANPKNADVVGVRVGRKKVALKKVSEKGIFEQLQKQLEDGIKRIDMKIDDMDTRLTYVESCVKNLKEAKDTKGEKEDGEKEKELEENDLDEDETETDKEKEKEKEDESSEKRSKVERMYGRKRTRTTTAKEQEEKGEEIQVGFQETSERGRKKAKLTWKKVDIKGVTADQGNSITTNKRVVVEPSSNVGSWKLASNLKSMRQYNAQVGSSLPPCSISCVDEPFSVSVSCKVNPGPLTHVVEKYPEALENLLPGSTVQNYILEVFDGYNNHVAEGTNVLICIEGYFINDSMGLNQKVNSCGCIDLSGILQVTAGYGKTISLSVMSGIDEIFKKESQTERRELMLLTKLPECCVAGSNLTNLIFKVTDSDGVMDTSIHHDEKSGCFHIMSIETDSSSDESAIRYAFVHGSCKVPTLSLPEREGVFSFKVFHSRFPELHLSLKIQLTPAQILQRDEIPYSRINLTPKSKMASTKNSPPLSSQTGPSLRDVAQFTESFQENLIGYSEHRVEIDERLNCLEAEQNQAKEELRTLQASLEPLGATFPECLSTKESMMKQIEEKHHDTAASVFCCLYRKSPPPQSLFLSKKGVFGLVALLGSVASTSLSRVLSEYLGEDMLLALVCKSAQIGPNNAEFLRLQSNHRFHVLCLDAIRPWKDGLLENDPQKKLAMVDPELPNGDPIPGFKDYAVNMIDLGPEELTIQTNSGYGLRETLFYNLFGNLQVYETQKQVEAALPHINGCGAVSLHGFIAIENGFIYSGCRYLNFS
ncbi:unnamed protein product [Arabidopsis thaliana]|uniref:DUF287 domain-containing protein n=1 Tax=Arabidopsis thaliana TaxID=3702 RepID=A0A654G3N0_ARATH|nr:unnamed protein product [Arabidopsis thaliana]